MLRVSYTYMLKRIVFSKEKYKSKAKIERERKNCESERG